MLVLEGESGAGGLRFTADATQLLASRHDGAVDLWTLATAGRTELFAPLDGRQHLRAVALHPIGAVRVASGDQPAAASLATRVPRIVSGVGGVEQLLISPQADWVMVERWGGLAGCRCGPDLRFDGEPIWEARHHDSRESFCAFVGNSDQFVTTNRGLLIVRKVSTGELLTTVKRPSRECRTSAASPDGKRFALMGYDKLYLWDTATWGKPTRVTGLNRWINSIAFHPTRPILLATQNLQPLVKFLDADTGAVIRKFTWKLGPLVSVAFSPDGTLAAAEAPAGRLLCGTWTSDRGHVPKNRVRQSSGR